MNDLSRCEFDREHQTWVEGYRADAAALVARLGRDGVEWLDAFLADYVFADEPLDHVLVKARQLSGLPSRCARAIVDD